MSTVYDGNYHPVQMDLDKPEKGLSELRIRALRCVASHSEEYNASECAFIGEYIAIADLTHDGQPNLTVQKIEDYVAENWPDVEASESEEDELPA